MKKIIAVLIVAATLLTGCGFFDKSYVVESDYDLPEGNESVREGLVHIDTFDDLRETIRNTVVSGEHTRYFLFDPEYTGNPSEDLASACWQVRTEDALCAYCVKNIAYDVYQLVALTEASISISYSDAALPVNEIISMPYETELNDQVAEAIRTGISRLAILISNSTLNEEDMTARFAEVYRRSPGLAPWKPECSVTMFSGVGTQRLYDILLDTGLSPEEFARRKAALNRVIIQTEPLATEAECARAVADRLKGCCDPDAGNSVYDALVRNAAGPEGISLGFVELCRRLGLESMIVYGQKDWQDHCWNIVRVDSVYYHVDLFAPMEDGYLKSDEEFWQNYRWNIKDYPDCGVPVPAGTVEISGQENIGGDSEPRPSGQEIPGTESVFTASPYIEIDNTPEVSETDPAAILPDGVIETDAVTVFPVETNGEAGG